MFYYYRDEEGYLVSRRPLSPLDYRLTAVSEQEIAQAKQLRYISGRTGSNGGYGCAASVAVRFGTKGSNTGYLRRRRTVDTAAAAKIMPTEKNCAYSGYG